jgi:hypothetical protein
MFGMLVDEGFFGETSMKGVKFAAQYHWPGPLHEGNGTVQPILDERSSPPQREAVLQIMRGQVGNPWFEVVSSLVSRALDPIVAPIEFKIDVKRRRARVVVPGVLETTVEPIKNLATGGSHMIDVRLPNGMEYKTAAICQAVVNRGTGPIQYDCPGGHSSLAAVEQTHAGLKR